MLLTNKQNDRQTNQRYQKHNLLVGYHNFCYEVISANLRNFDVNIAMQILVSMTESTVIVSLDIMSIALIINRKTTEPYNCKQRGYVTVSSWSYATCYL